MIKNFALISLIFLSFSAFAAKKLIKEGPWRFEMRATYATIPFIIEFKYSGKKLNGTLKNGKESIPLNDIEVKKNTIKIPLQLFENALEFKIMSKEAMKGDFVRYNKNPEARIPIEGMYGLKERYIGRWHKPAQDLSGNWEVTLKEEDGQKSKGVVILKQKGHKLNGTIMSTTGDYRYFEGYVDGELFEVASFDGVMNYAFKGRVTKGKMEASIVANWITTVVGVKNDKATLPDPYKQTQLDKLSFTYPDINGFKVSLTDEKFKNKPVIVTFFGSWCPNCLDETNFLSPWYKKNQSRGVEIIALAFERSLSEAQAKMQITKTVKKLGIPFTVLLVGTTSEDRPMDKIPGLKNFISFPTTVFLNRQHEVVKIHAGFTGPATGKNFDVWKKEFNDEVTGLLK